MSIVIFNFLSKKNMHLFERVKLIAKHFAGSDKALATQLGLKQPTFFGYLNEKRQDTLYPLLPKILDLYPQVRRDWLYFGEGEMAREAGPRVAVPPMTTAVPPARAAMGAADGSTESDAPLEVIDLRQKLMAAHELNARLTDANTRLTDEVLRLNEERRKLMERMDWDKVSDKTALSPLVARGGLPDEN